VVCLLVALVTGAGAALAYPLTQPSLWPLLLFIGLFACALPSLCFLIGIRVIGGMRAGVVMLWEPVVGVALAAVLLGQTLQPIQLLGGAAILAAALLLQRTSPLGVGAAARTATGLAEAHTGYDVAGPADGPTVVFIHATRLTRGMWAEQVARLSDTHRVITLDLPGHGTRAAEPFSLDGAADIVARVIDQAAGGRACVVGLSLGGYVGMHLAERSPDRVRGLVLAGASAEPSGIRATPYRALGWVMDTFDGHGLDTLNRWFFRTRFGPAISEPIIAGGFWSTGGAAALRCLAGHAFKPSLAAYPGPTLILNGSLDLPFRLDQRGFKAAAQDARIVRIAGATHLSNLDRPGAFSEAVRRFTAGLD
jgi:pimeloyl-ACP methyl ester carboxylesterase